MANLTKRIGLSLGADLCWPRCFEDLLAELDPAIPVGDDVVRVQTERVTIEPFDLRAPASYDLVIDRLTHWYGLTREWIKKTVLMDGTYVFNNPWSVQSMEKQTSYCAMMRLGMPIPDTWLLPPKEYDEQPDLEVTLERYARMFELAEVGERVGYPCFMKPYDGGGWVGVSCSKDVEELRAAYDASGKFVMHVQKGVDDYDRFVRCIGVGPQVHFVSYDPEAPHHERYREDSPEDFLSPEDRSELEDAALTINSFFGWDFNSSEYLLAKGVWSPIDFANPCPDSQVTSLHVHFPWLVKAKLRWALFVAVTGREMRLNLNWEPYFEIAASAASRREKLAAYAALAREHFQTERFEQFCDQHLGSLDELTWDYFGTDRAREAVRLKVESIFPEHEHESFTDHFWSAIQRWRDRDAAGRETSA
jgi:hypothetical protein